MRAKIWWLYTQGGWYHYTIIGHFLSHGGIIIPCNWLNLPPSSIIIAFGQLSGDRREESEKLEVGNVVFPIEFNSHLFISIFIHIYIFIHTPVQCPCLEIPKGKYTRIFLPARLNNSENKPAVFLKTVAELLGLVGNNAFFLNIVFI